MPLFNFDAPPTTEAPKPAEKPATIVCTIEPGDTGTACGWCGYATGSGHGKKR